MKSSPLAIPISNAISFVACDLLLGSCFDETVNETESSLISNISSTCSTEIPNDSAREHTEKSVALSSEFEVALEGAETVRFSRVH